MLLYLIHVIGISCNKDNECVIMMIILACLYRMESKRRAAWRGCPAVWCTCLSWWLFITWVKGQMWADNSWPLGTECQWLCSCISLPQRQHSALRLSHDFFFSIFTIINQTRFPTHVPRVLGTRLRRFHDQFNNKELKLYQHNWISRSLPPIENLSTDLTMLNTNTCNITEVLPH